MKKLSLYKPLQLTLLAFLFSLFAKAQVLDSTLALYGSKYVQERCYLHYDKTAYVAGETIWFKAYLMEGIYPAESSKTLYIDWVDDKGNLLYHTSAPIVEGGVTNGQFEVPENYNGSFIHVSAYTKWMLNFDTAFLYKKNIRIIPKTISAGSYTLPAAVPLLRFFPEGGELVAGIRNKIAFKAADQWGQPVRIKGVVQKNGVTVDSLKVVHDGMGSFLLTPEAGARYTAKWRDAKNTEHTTELPMVQASGLSMQISILPGKRVFTINRTADVPEHLKTLHLVGTMQQSMVFKANVDLKDKATTSGVIPIQTLPTGIVTITLFDDKWNAIAERITHVNNNEYFFPSQIEVKRWGLSKRGRNEIELTVPSNVVANLSVAITDAAIETDSSKNIISHFLLTSELKGEVYNPSYYFKNNSDSLAQKLDLVMLTNGWRRFKWEDVTRGKFPVINYSRDTSYLTLSGKVFGLTPGQLGGGGALVMMVKEKDSAAKMMMTPVATDGTFNDPNYLFFDTLRIYYQPTKQLKGATVNFMTSRLASLNYKNKGFGNSFFPDTTGFYRHALLAEEAASILRRYRGKVLAEVTVTAKQKPPVQVLDEKYTSGLFKGMDAMQFDLINDPFAGSTPNIFTYLQGKVAGLQITTGGASTSLQWRGGPPLLFLDEISTDPSMISSIPVQDIAYIKVFRPPFMGSGGSMYGNGSNGAIAIYTRRGGDLASKPGSGMTSNTAIGYSPIREFYSPNYATFVRANEERDVRTTLYWRPQIVVGGNKNKAMLVFYNSDVYSKALRIVIEGITKDGQLTHHEEVIE